MKDALNPQNIYDKILQNEIKATEGIRYLISIVERSDKPSARLESLEILYKLKAHNDNIFKILENCIISDENEEIRIISAKILLELYGQEGKECLKWGLCQFSTETLSSIRKPVLPYCPATNSFLHWQ